MLKVRRAGFFTSIQDQGRFGFRHIGVPVSGVMDAYSASIANTLLDNPEDAAVMELTMTGPTLEFEHPTYLAISGADLSPKLNEQAIRINQVHKVAKGDIISFGKLLFGFRAYLAVKNGFGTGVYMKSRSFFRPVTPLHTIRDQMEIPIESVREYEARISSVSPEPFHKEHELEVYRGPEYDMLSDRQLEAIFAGDFTIAKENNRMAYQLQETIPGHQTSMLTSATLPGTVQYTPAGKLILLMKDGQTTGGYPRILQLSSTAICILSQKKYGDSIKFHLK
jgi:biotin-dependent carboxylase-like uncharacterized protein